MIYPLLHLDEAASWQPMQPLHLTPWLQHFLNIIIWDHCTSWQHPLFQLLQIHLIVVFNFLTHKTATQCSHYAPML